MARQGLHIQLFSVGLAFMLGFIVTMMLWGLNIHSRSTNFQADRLTRDWGLTGDTSKQVEWKLFGEELLSDEDLKNIHLQSTQNNDPSQLMNRNTPQQLHTGSRVLLESLPKVFQQQLHASTPLSCYTRDDGLISIKYKRFLRTLIDYSSFHKSSGEMMGTARTLVWQCTLLDYCGGLVDRMKGITYALLLAMFSRRRLILYWGGPEHTFLHPNMIDWTDHPLYDYVGQYDVVTDYETEFDKKRPNLGTADESSLPFEFHMFSILSDSGVDVSADELRYNLEFIGSRAKTVILSTNLEPCTLFKFARTGDHKWIKDGLQWTGLSSLSPQDVDNVVGIAFRYLFQMSPELILEVARARNVLGLGDNVPYTGIHIRTGFAGSSNYSEDKEHPKLMHRESDWNDMLKCAVSKADSFLGNSSLLFLATDSVLVKHMAVSKYGGRIRTLGNSLIHLDKMKKQPHTLQEEQNEIEGVLTNWVDFLLLAEAYAHVRGNSGFPWAAGLLCSIPNERLIDGSTCLPESQHHS